MNHYNVVTRLLEILRLVRAGDYPSSNHMAAATGVGWRTIQRDLDFLRQLGAPLEYNEQKRGWRLKDKKWRLDR
jgi:predicted DNA-binding transcriptional regulator YafY